MYKKNFLWTGVCCWVTVAALGCSSDYLDDEEGAVDNNTGNIVVADSDTGMGDTDGDTDSNEVISDTDSNAVEVTTQMLEQFDDGNIVNELGGTWLAFDDGFDNGDSVVVPVSVFKDGVFEAEAPGYGDTGSAAHVTGTTGNVLGWDYLGFLASTGPDVLCPNADDPEIDLTQFDGIQFMAKGTAIPQGLYFKIPHEQTGAEDNCGPGYVTPYSLTNYDDFETDFGALLTEEWQLIRIPFEDMMRSSSDGLTIDDVLATAKSLVWHLQVPLTELDLWIDDVAFYALAQ